MTFDPKTYITLAEYLNSMTVNLPPEVGEEPASRTVLNRFYYGISTQAHYFLLKNVNDNEYKARAKKNHNYLRERLSAVDHREAKLLSADLGKLFKMRWEADYRYPVSVPILQVMIKDQRHRVAQAQLKLNTLINAFPQATQT